MSLGNELVQDFSFGKTNDEKRESRKAQNKVVVLWRYLICQHHHQQEQQQHSKIRSRSSWRYTNPKTVWGWSYLSLSYSWQCIIRWDFGNECQCQYRWYPRSRLMKLRLWMCQSWFRNSFLSGSRSKWLVSILLVLDVPHSVIALV